MLRCAYSALVVGSTLLIGCAPTSTTRVPIPETARRTSWVASGLPVHTQLSATRDSIVYGGVTQGTLYVVALDPETGRERWRRGSNASARHPNAEQSILTDGDTAYFVLGYRSHAVLVAVTTATGEERWRRELWDVPVDPSFHSCGDAVCVLAYTPRAKLWAFAKADGSEVADHAISEEGNRFGAVLATDSPDGVDAALLVASSEAITQLANRAHTQVWSKSMSQVFGRTPVSLNGGAGGRRVDGGWIAWIGPPIRSELEAGDTFPSGVVAGLDDRGNSQWIATDRHLCAIFPSSATLCDGRWQMVSARRSEIRPNVVEGRDPTTGVVKWKLDLHGEIEELDTDHRVMRIDEDRYLVRLSSGSVLLDARDGPEPARLEPTVAWCKTKVDFERIGARTFARARNPFPCRLGDRFDPMLPIPEFAGVNVAGWGAWVEDGWVHAKRQPD